MKLLTVACHQCGAPLEVPRSVRFLTCQFCSSQLAIQREGNVAYTALHDLTRRAAQIETNMDDLRRHIALETLEREWQSECQRIAARHEGILPEPGVPVSNAAGISIGFGIALLVPAVWLTMQNLTPLTLLLPCSLIAFGLAFQLWWKHAVEDYGLLRREYRQRQHDICSEAPEPQVPFQPGGNRQTRLSRSGNRHVHDQTVPHAPAQTHRLRLSETQSDP